MADGSIPPAQTLRVLAVGLNWFAPGSGGLDRVFHDLALGLPDMHVALRGLVVGPTDVATLTGGQVRAFGGNQQKLPARLLRARNALAAALRDEKPDVVAAHFALFVAPSLDLLSRQPFVMHFHGPWADEAAEEGAGAVGRALRRQLERAVYARASHVITLSRAFAALAQHRYGIPAERISVIPGSVDLARFAPTISREAARAALGWPSGRPVLLAVRRLVRRMGLDLLIEAMPAVLRAMPDAVLMIAGRGTEEAALRQLAVRCGVAEQIRFLGFVPEHDLPLAYRAADINVVPSRALEGFGLTAAEALAAGTPSIVAPVGGLPEVVAPLCENLVFRSATVEDIAAGLVAALQAGVPDEAACRSYALERFSPARVIAETASIYRQAAE